MFNTHLYYFDDPSIISRKLQSPCNLVIKGGLVGVQSLDRCMGSLENLKYHGQSTNFVAMLGCKKEIGGEGSFSPTISFSLDAIWKVTS